MLKWWDEAGGSCWACGPAAVPSALLQQVVRASVHHLVLVILRTNRKSVLRILEFNWKWFWLVIEADSLWPQMCCAWQFLVLLRKQGCRCSGYSELAGTPPSPPPPLPPPVKTTQSIAIKKLLVEVKTSTRNIFNDLSSLKSIIIAQKCQKS